MATKGLEDRSVAVDEGLKVRQGTFLLPVCTDAQRTLACFYAEQNVFTLCVVVRFKSIKAKKEIPETAKFKEAVCSGHEDPEQRHA